MFSTPISCVALLKGTGKLLPAAVVAFSFAMAVAAQEKPEYEVGGPLAGVKLPLYKTQHGEPAGHPGCIPALAQKAIRERAEAIRTGKGEGPFVAGAVPYSTQGMQPEVELYPNAVEHFRDGMFKYLPIRSFFDRQSLLKNFVAPNIPGATAQQVEEYAEPVYWVGRHDAIQFTGQKKKAVPVVRCKIGVPIFKLDLGTLDHGLYAVRVIAAVETGKLRPFREPLFLKLRVNSGLAGEGTSYRKRVFYNDQFYGITAFYFHAPERRSYSVELAVDSRSKVELLVHNITLDNVLAGCEWKSLKTSRTLPRGIANPDVFSENYVGKRTSDTPDERWARDAAIWKSFPPLNAQPGGHEGIAGVSYGAEGLADVEQRWADGKSRLFRTTAGKIM